MLKLTKHMRVEMLILTCLALGSCGDSAPRTFTQGDRDKLEAAYANGFNAARASSAMVDRVERLEGRVDELESKLGM